MDIFLPIFIWIVSGLFLPIMIADCFLNKKSKWILLLAPLGPLNVIIIFMVIGFIFIKDYVEQCE